ncbi:MAG TPA: Crp/Fnr family transcriptional regulator [Sulfuricaulis sp.]|nr:Crp/Fnr family transcriptional regulator [Sulfuricaulis sp.]
MSIAMHTRATNSVLRALSPVDNKRLLAHSEQVDLTYGDILCEPGKQIRYVYFPNDGIISLLTPLDGHDSAEVGLVGREGMAGMALFLGVSVSPVRMLVQGTGTATRMKAVSFRKELKRNPVLQLELGHYLYAFMAQVTQTAACNRHHQLGERLARWLLMTHDRVQSNEYHLTQEFLAHMLGVRRVGVTRAAGLLQDKKLISYRRGNITILNRKGLERASCRCYRDVNNIRDRMLGGAMGQSIS